MKDGELRSIVTAEIDGAIGFYSSEISSAQADAIDQYFGRPYGNEQEGRSSVVSRDTMEVVEWIMPQLMRIFLSSDEVVRFQPTGPEDVEAAKQASDYCSYVWNEDNDGFLNTYTAIKDGLIEKVGVVKVYWDEQEEYEREEYHGLDDVAFTQVVMSPDVEVVEHETERGPEYPGPVGIMTSDLFHNVTIKRKNTKGRAKVEPVPSEEFLISREAKTIQGARFVAHRYYPTRSDLIAEGYKKRIVESLGTDSGGVDFEQEAARQTFDHTYERSSENNTSMETVEVFECYIRADYDGDGVAEMRKVVVAGNGRTVLENEEWGGSRPFAGWTPIVIPHKFHGLSISDLLEDIQRIKTAVERSYLDSLYNAIQPQKEVDVDRLVDKTGGEVKDVRPNALVRKRGPEPVITPVITASVSAEALQGLEAVDNWRENRTGVSQRTLGLSDDVLHDTKGGQDRLMTMAMGRIELIARCFAEMFMREVMELIYELLHRYQDKPRAVELRGEWVEVNPRSWRSKMDTKATVGLGNGSMDQQAAAAQSVLGVLIEGVKLQGGANGPLVTLQNLHYAASKVIEAAGYKDVDSFITDPKSMMMDDPRLAQAQKMIQALQVQVKQLQDDRAVEIRKQDIDREKNQGQLRVDAFKAETDRLAKTREPTPDDNSQEMLLEIQKTNAEMQFKSRESALDREESARQKDLDRGSEILRALLAKVDAGGEGQEAPSGVSDAVVALREVADRLGMSMEALVGRVSGPKNVSFQYDENGDIVGAITQ